MARTWKVGARNLPQTELARFYRTEILRISQTQMAELTGVYQSNIAAHENGKWQAHIHNAFIDLGLAKWVDGMTTRQEVVIGQIISGIWHKDLHEKYPDIVPIESEE